VNLKKRALGLVVTAGVVGSAVGIAAPSAGAAAIPPPDTCGVYIQGTIDPAGGVLPSGILPLDPPATLQTYSASGHLRKGQNKVINDLNNSALAIKRFSTGAELGEDAVKYPGSYLVGPGIASGTLTGPPAGGFAPDAAPTAGASTTVQVAWANHKTIAGVTLLPTVQVEEKDNALAKYKAAKGTVTGISGGDTLGVGLGVFQQGQSVPVLQNTQYALKTPRTATSGTFTLSLTIPADALGPGIPPVPIPLSTVHDWDDSAAAIEATMDAVYTPTLGGLDSVDVSGTDFVAGTTDGNYIIEFNGVFTGSTTPTLSVPTGTTTGTLATTVLSDGSIWTGTRFGGPDPSNSPISHLGNFPPDNVHPQGPYNGIYTASGVMSSGVRGGIAGKNTGKANIVPDTQFVFVQYPALIETTVAPRIGTGDAAMLATLGVLGAITGLDVATLNRNCGAAGLLALFCYSQPAIIPPTFAGLCGAILG
jgi:hypothetical protein